MGHTRRQHDGRTRQKAGHWDPGSRCYCTQECQSDWQDNQWNGYSPSQVACCIRLKQLTRPQIQPKIPEMVQRNCSTSECKISSTVNALMDGSCSPMFPASKLTAMISWHKGCIELANLLDDTCSRPQKKWLTSISPRSSLACCRGCGSGKQDTEQG